MSTFRSHDQIGPNFINTDPISRKVRGITTIYLFDFIFYLEAGSARTSDILVILA